MPPKVHTIKAARKNYPAEGIKKGDTYYKWSIKTGPASGIVYRSNTYPKPSELTGSPFQRSLLEIQERIGTIDAEGYETAEDFSSDIEGIISDIEALRDETQGSLENMPEGLQQGDVGQMLQERIDGLDGWISDLQGVDLDFLFDEDEPKEPEEPKKEDFAIEANFDLVFGSYRNAHAEWKVTHEVWETAKQEAETEFISNAIEEIQGMEASV